MLPDSYFGCPFPVGMASANNPRATCENTLSLLETRCIVPAAAAAVASQGWLAASHRLLPQSKQLFNELLLGTCESRKETIDECDY